MWIDTLKTKYLGENAKVLKQRGYIILPTSSIERGGAHRSWS